MEALSEEILQAAQEFGAALADSPAMQAYRAAQAAVDNDPGLCQLEAEVSDMYESLSAKQRCGKFLTQAEINQFYHLREQLAHHPLIIELQLRQQAVQALFEQAGGSLNTILTVDFSALAE